MRLIALAVLIFGGLCEASGQPVPSRSFEVASVRPRLGPFSRLYVVSTSGPRFTAEASSVIELIMYAYNLKNYQVSRPASFRDSETLYDVVAKAEGESVPTKEEFRQMVRLLLAERFQLRFHRETKEMPVYALVVGKNGSKLKESGTTAEHQWRLSVSGRHYQVTMRQVTLEDITSAIANASLDRPIVDRTGLSGTYDVTLTYRPNLIDRADSADSSDISIFTAVQEQLGLKLEPRSDMVEVLVVDHVEKPSQN